MLKNSKIENKTVHKNVTCNLCSMYPIIGNRFKCTICYDYDLCESCENATAESHPHPMMKHRVEINDSINTFQTIYNPKNCKPIFVEDILKKSDLSKNKLQYRWKLKELRNTYDLKSISDEQILIALEKTNGNSEEAIEILFC